MNVAYNMDCLASMREMEDNAFDLAVVDPPYGAGFTEGGGCKGWFTKYNERERERERRRTAVNRSGSTAATDGANTSTIARTGGTWAEKYGKKS